MDRYLMFRLSHSDIRNRSWNFKPTSLRRFQDLESTLDDNGFPFERFMHVTVLHSGPLRKVNRQANG